MTGENQFNSRIGFEKEIMPCLDNIYNFAFRITGSDRIAYKLLKETCIKGLRFYNHLDESIVFEPWMLRIMRNIYLESSSKKLPVVNIDYQKIQVQFANLNSLDIDHLKKVFFEKLAEKEISDLLALIQDEFKMVIVLSSIMGFNYEAIVDFVDVPPGIVRLRLHRGRKILFIKLYNYAADKEYIKKVIKETSDIEIKENRDYYYIAALADDELKNNPEEAKIKESITKDPGLLFEYNVQVLIKKLMAEKLKNITTPPGIKKKMERKIGSLSKSIAKESK